MDKTNKEFFGGKPLNEALAKYAEDTDKGLALPFMDWLDSTYVDISKGKFVRGVFYTYEEIEDKIRNMESKEVTGYLLEFKDEKGDWFGSEFEPEKGMDSNLWANDSLDAAHDDWYNHDTQEGFFKALDNAWFSSSDDWDFRLGVAFDAQKTPKENPKESGIWEGLAIGGCCSDGAPWRVRKVTIKGELSDKAKDFIRRNPDIWFEYAA